MESKHETPDYPRQWRVAGCVTRMPMNQPSKFPSNGLFAFALDFGHSSDLRCSASRSKVGGTLVAGRTNGNTQVSRMGGCRPRSIQNVNQKATESFGCHHELVEIRKIGKSENRSPKLKAVWMYGRHCTFFDITVCCFIRIWNSLARKAPTFMLLRNDFNVNFGFGCRFGQKSYRIDGWWNKIVRRLSSVTETRDELLLS